MFKRSATLAKNVSQNRIIEKPDAEREAYIEVILGWGSSLHWIQDHGTGKHGSPPSCAQSAVE